MVFVGPVFGFHASLEGGRAVVEVKPATELKLVSQRSASVGFRVGPCANLKALNPKP